MFYLDIIILISAALTTTSKEAGYIIMCVLYKKRTTTTAENIYLCDNLIKASQFSSTLLSPMGLDHL